MRIEDRVRLAFDMGMNKDFLPMLSFVLPAVEASAKKKYGVGGRRTFIDFIRANHDVIHWFSGLSLDFNRLKFPTLDPALTDGKIVERPDLAQVLYFLHRCALAHGENIGENFAILPRRPDGGIDFLIGKDGKALRLPEPIVWGVLAAVVLDPINADLSSRSDNHFLLLFPPNTYFLNVDIFWGAKDKVEKVAAKYEPPPDQTDNVMNELGR